MKTEISLFKVNLSSYQINVCLLTLVWTTVREMSVYYQSNQYRFFRLADLPCQIFALTISV